MWFVCFVFCVCFNAYCRCLVLIILVRSSLFILFIINLKWNCVVYLICSWCLVFDLLCCSCWLIGLYFEGFVFALYLIV